MAPPKRIMIAAWGSRGDLQPVTALALALKTAGRDVLVFATPPATDLLKTNGIDYIEAKENIADFVESMFGHADLSARGVVGFQLTFKSLRSVRAGPAAAVDAHNQQERGGEL